MASTGSRQTAHHSLSELWATTSICVKPQLYTSEHTSVTRAREAFEAGESTMLQPCGPSLDDGAGPMSENRI